MPRKKAKRSRGMGRVFKRGGTWAIRWREGGRRRFKGGFPDEGTAVRVLGKILIDVAEGRSPDAPDLKNLPTLLELAGPWIARRENTHRSWRDDRSRWNTHLGPFLGHCRPPEVDAAMIRRFIESRLSSGLSSTTTGHCVRLLSTFFSDVIERGYASVNPVASLPRSTRRLFRDAHDPKQTPFLERQEDIRRVFLALEQPFAAVFAVQALAGLRPGEALALEWGDIDLGAGRMLIQRQVRAGRVGPCKSGRPRLVPLIKPLVKILAEYRLATGGVGRLFGPVRPRKEGHARPRAQYLRLNDAQAALHVALEACGLPRMTLYSCGRHTYGAQHVMGGGSLATLREILGHSSVTTTERYGHIRPDLFKASDLMQFGGDMSRPGGEVVDLAAHREERRAFGHSSGTADVDEGPGNGVSTDRV